MNQDRYQKVIEEARAAQAALKELLAKIDIDSRGPRGGASYDIYVRMTIEAETAEQAAGIAREVLVEGIDSIDARDGDGGTCVDSWGAATRAEVLSQDLANEDPVLWEATAGSWLLQWALARRQGLSPDADVAAKVDQIAAIADEAGL